MGKFANELDGQGNVRHLGDTTEVEGDDGFAALGKRVPAYRKSAAEQHCKNMGCTDRERVFRCIEAMSLHIERDEPHAAMERALAPAWGGHPDGIVDAIGVYRLLAVLLTAQPSKAEAV